MSEKNSLTVIILTYNEALHIERCIRSTMEIAKHVFVVDSFSTDRTVEIAESLGAEVYQHKFINYAQQFQWALDTLRVKTEWIMRLDADEFLEPALIEEIKRSLPSLSWGISGINLNRRHIFMGRWVKHGARYPLILLRIWRRGRGRIEQRWMDEHIVVEQGEIITFEHDFSDHNLHDINRWVEKHNKYAIREAIDVMNRKYSLFDSDEIMLEVNRFSQAVAKRLIKERIYNRLPLFLGPLLYFLYRYFFCIGFLDGKEGLAYHFLQGFWYRFIVEVKVMELDRELKKLSDNKTRLSKLEELTGYPIG